MKISKIAIIVITSNIALFSATLVYGQIAHQPANIESRPANIGNPLEKVEKVGEKTEVNDAPKALSNSPKTTIEAITPEASSILKEAEAGSETLKSEIVEAESEGIAINPTAIVTLTPANETDTIDLEKLVKDWTTAFNKRDITATCALFSKEVVANYHGVPTKHYKDICGNFRKIFADKSQRYEYKYKIHNIYRLNDLAVIRITWYLHTFRNGQEISVIQDEGMDVLMKNNKDQWHIINYLAYQKPSQSINDKLKVK